MTRFLCCADLQIGKGATYGRQPGDRLADQARNWASIVTLARDERCDAILLAGDAFERKQTTNDEEDAFLQPLVRHGIRVIAIPGNHDGNEPGRKTTLDNVADAGLIDLYREPGIAYVHDTAILTLPWTSVARIVAAHGGGDRDATNELAAELLLNVARGINQPRRSFAKHAVLMTHFAVTGAVGPNGEDVGGYREPVLNLRDLEGLGYEAVVLGHVHKPQLLSAGAPIFYCGSPMPLDFAEAKTTHGVCFLEVDERGGHVDFVALEVKRQFVTLEYDFTVEPTVGLSTSTEQMGFGLSLPNVANAIVKVRYRATPEQGRRIDHAQLRRALYDAGAYNVWSIQPEIVKPERVMAERVDETLDERAAFDVWLRANQINGKLGATLASLHADYLQEVQR